MMREQHFALEKEPQVLLRPASGSKFALKEKFVQVYEAFFVGDDPSIGRESFWDEVFLLKVNAAFLGQCFAVTSEEQLLALKDNINKIFMQCLVFTRDGNAMRARNAMETMCVVTRGVAGKKFNNIGFDVLNLLTGVDQADRVFKDLMESLNTILLSQTQPVLVKQSALRLIGVLLTCIENLHANTIVELMMQHDVFRSLVHVIVDPTTKTLALDAVILLTILGNYKKYESQNAYMAQIAGIRNAAILESFAAALDTEIDRFYGQLLRLLPAQSPMEVSTTWASQLFSSLWGGAAPSAADVAAAYPPQSPNINGSGTAFSSAFDGEEDLPDQTVRLSASFLAIFDLVRNSKVFMYSFVKPLSLRKGVALNTSRKQRQAEGDDEPATAEGEDGTANPDVLNTPPLCAFLSMVSLLAHISNKSDEYLQQLMLALFTLQTLVEDAAVAGAICDKKQVHKVTLVQRRVRKFTLDPLPRPFLGHIYDTMLILIWTSLRKPLPAELICTAVGVIHRLVVFQFRNKLRIPYDWKSLFDVLFVLFEKVSQQFQTNAALLPLSAAVARLVHLIIMHGDVFIHMAVSYDQLVYHLLRQEANLATLRASVSTHTANAPSPLASALIDDLAQLSAVQRYFNEQIEANKILHGSMFLTSEGVLQIIRNNLEGLQLRPVDVESYDRFNESPTHLKFFRSILRSIVAGYRQSRLITASQ